MKYLNLLFLSLATMCFLSMATEVNADAKKIDEDQSIRHAIDVDEVIPVLRTAELKELPKSASKNVAAIEPLSKIKIIESPKFEEAIHGWISYWYKVQVIGSGKIGYVWQGNLPLIYRRIDGRRSYALVQNEDGRTASLFYVFDQSSGEASCALPPSFMEYDGEGKESPYRYGPYSISPSENFKKKSEAGDQGMIQIKFEPDADSYAEFICKFNVVRQKNKIEVSKL